MILHRPISSNFSLLIPLWAVFGLHTLSSTERRKAEKKTRLGWLLSVCSTTCWDRCRPVLLFCLYGEEMSRELAGDESQWRYLALRFFIFLKRSQFFDKKVTKKNQSAISGQTDALTRARKKKKKMNARGSFEAEFFLFNLIKAVRCWLM